MKDFLDSSYLRILFVSQDIPSLCLEHSQATVDGSSPSDV